MTCLWKGPGPPSPKRPGHGPDSGQKGSWERAAPCSCSPWGPLSGLTAKGPQPIPENLTHWGLQRSSQGWPCCAVSENQPLGLNSSSLPLAYWLSNLGKSPSSLGLSFLVCEMDL